MLAWLAGPSLVSIVLTGFIDGKAGYRNLLARLATWRVRARWYAVALLTARLVYVTQTLGLLLISPAFLPSLVVADDKGGLSAMGLALRPARRRLP